MTIALSIKVHDGLVLAADSAGTIIGPHGAGAAPAVFNVYNNANKIFNLYKGLPIGGMCWGAGSIGTASISSWAKDLRKRLMGKDPGHADWAIKQDNYTIEQIAQRVRSIMFEEAFAQAYQNTPPPPGAETGFLVAGYSSGEGLAEDWLVQIVPNAPPPILPRAREDVGCTCYGDTEAVQRILLGYGSALPVALASIGMPANRIPAAIGQITQIMSIPLVLPPMPIQDVIDLAEFLVHLAVMYSRFRPGPPTVGGPIEIAAITKHEGFKWIKRKHYYHPRLNPLAP